MCFEDIYDWSLAFFNTMYCCLGFAAIAFAARARNAALPTTYKTPASCMRKTAELPPGGLYNFDCTKYSTW